MFLPYLYKKIVASIILNVSRRWKKGKNCGTITSLKKGEWNTSKIVEENKFKRKF